MYVSLHGPGWLYVLGITTCHFDPPERVLRTAARAQTCTVVFRRAICVPRSREHQTRPAAGRKKKPKYQRNTFIYIVIQGSLSGCVLREIPGATKVEKGHVGNTAVATPYYYVGWNMVTEASGQQFPLTIIIYICFEHCLFVYSFRHWCVLRVDWNRRVD